MEPVVVSGLVLGSVIFCIGLLSAIIRRRRDSKTKHGRQQVSNEKVVIPEERLKELAGPTDFINWSPTKLLHEAHEMAVMIAALTAEVDALKSTNVDLEKRCDDFIESLQDSIGGVILKKIVSPEIGFVPEDIQRCIEWLKAEVARLSAPVSTCEWEFHHRKRSGIALVNALILARATPPQDVEKKRSIGFPRDKTDEWEARQDVEKS